MEVIHAITYHGLFTIVNIYATLPMRPHSRKQQGLDSLFGPGEQRLRYGGPQRLVRVWVPQSQLALHGLHSLQGPKPSAEIECLDSICVITTKICFL